jgi:serine protease Do
LTERSSRQIAVRHIERRVTSAEQDINSLSAQNATLAQRISQLGSSVQASKAGLAPLAHRVLQSVFTIQVSDGLGTAWSAWTAGGDTYLITANHVVADDVAAGIKTAKLEQKGNTWTAEIGRTDPTNDLAVVIVQGLIAPPLWQQPQLGVSPVVGDELILVGSPYGLQGTVTNGVVSRVTYDQIQTDAAANPGNSGGPAVDRQGQVVGVLLSGGGENLNFAVPIQRACVAIRSC